MTLRGTARVRTGGSRGILSFRAVISCCTFGKYLRNMTGGSSRARFQKIKKQQVRVDGEVSY